MVAKTQYVIGQAGSQGGAMLIVPPEKLTLQDIYDAVEDQSIFCMHQPHPKCPVACCVKDQVNELLEGAEEKMKAELARTRLSKITKPAIEQYRQMSK